MSIVYAIADDAGKIVYIGCTRMTLDDRIGDHFSRRTVKKMTPIAVWMRSLDERPYAYELERLLDGDDMYVAESRWIKFFRSVPGVELLNVKDQHGGGTKGSIKSLVSRQKLSKTLTGRPKTTAMLAALPRGERNGVTTLTEEHVLAIRAEPDDIILDILAKKYGVCIATIHNIRKRKTWKHILCLASTMVTAAGFYPVESRSESEAGHWIYMRRWCNGQHSDLLSRMIAVRVRGGARKLPTLSGRVPKWCHSSSTVLLGLVLGYQILSSIGEMDIIVAS